MTTSHDSTQNGDSMRRSDKLIQLILEHVEKHGRPGTPLDQPTFQDYTENEVGYHVMLCEQAGFLDAVEFSSMGNPYRFQIMHLNWEGHEALKRIRQATD